MLCVQAVSSALCIGCKQCCVYRLLAVLCVQAVSSVVCTGC